MEVTELTEEQAISNIRRYAHCIVTVPAKEVFVLNASNEKDPERVFGLIHNSFAKLGCEEVESYGNGTGVFRDGGTVAKDKLKLAQIKFRYNGNDSTQLERTQTSPTGAWCGY